MDQHEFEFVEESVPWAPAPGIESLLADGDQCYSYFEESAESLCSALKDLDDYIATEGSFDAVMAFSQGASLAAIYIVYKTQQDQTAINPVFRCAILLCAGDAWDSDGEASVLKASSVGQLITVPTARIVDSKDPFYPASLGLIEIDDSGCRVVFDHRGGHDVPRDTQTTKDIVHTIKGVREMAHLTQ